MKKNYYSILYAAFFLISFLFFLSFLSAENVEMAQTQEITALEGDVPLQLKDIDKKRPFHENGEKLRFKVVFIGLTAGYASFEMRPANESSDGQVFFRLSAESAKWVSRIYTLKMDMFSYANPVNYATVKYIEEKRERKNYYYATQYFLPNGSGDEEGLKLQYTWRKNDSYSVKTFAEALQGVSVPAAFYFARSTDLEVGKIYYTTCAFRDRIVPIGVQVVEKKRVNTEYGKQDTIVIRPLMRFDGLISDQRDMLIYLSDDEYKIPLLMEAITKFGKFKALLIEGYEQQKEAQDFLQEG